LCSEKQLSPLQAGPQNIAKRSLICGRITAGEAVISQIAHEVCERRCSGMLADQPFPVRPTVEHLYGPDLPLTVPQFADRDDANAAL
jgi:hypothetical protein